MHKYNVLQSTLGILISWDEAAIRSITSIPSGLKQTKYSSQVVLIGDLGDIGCEAELSGADEDKQSEKRQLRTEGDQGKYNCLHADTEDYSLSSGLHKMDKSPRTLNMPSILCNHSDTYLLYIHVHSQGIRTD